MESLSTIQKAVDYIEDNLKFDISIGQVADAIGYSEYHFLRIFKRLVGLTPADYIRKRRISEIVARMECGGRPISDIAFEYGFNSKENFIRAFKSEHHILPTEYRRHGNSLKLYGRFELVPRCEGPLCDVVELDAFRVVAYPSDEDDPTKFWNRYNVNGLSSRLSGGRTVADYGVCRWNASTSRLDYWTGVDERDAAGDTTGTITLTLSEGLYGVFKTTPASHTEFVSTIGKTWDFIRDVWLPQSRFERRPDYEFERYVEESRLFSETIFVPIRMKSE